MRSLTYEAATSLNMYLSTSSTPAASPTRSPSSAPWFNAPSFAAAITNKQQNSMLKALREGLPSVGLREDLLLFGVGPSGFRWGLGTEQSYNLNMTSSRNRHSGSWSEQDNNKTVGQKTVLLGDTFVVKVESLDDSLWKCGGAAVGLKLVDLAEVNFLPFMRFFSNHPASFRHPMGFPVPLAFSQMASRIAGKIPKTWKECVGSSPAFRDV